MLPLEGKAEMRILDKGLNFCPQPKYVNTTKVIAGIKKMRRSALWKDHHAFNDEDVGYEAKSTIIPGPKKSNLPKTQPSRGMEKFLDSIEEGILSAPIQPYRSNIHKDEEIAMAKIVEAQKKRLITVKPNNKMGGQSILPTEDYIDSLMAQLEDSYVDKQGQTHQYYQPVEPFLLTTHHTAIKDFLDGAVNDGVITQSDAALLLDEEPKAGRLYGLVKNHKPIKPGNKIPDLRPVVSNSGSTTEKISLAIDQEAKNMVPNLPSFWQDSPHAIRDLRAENSKGPQPTQCIPVTADVTALYPNIPLKEGMEKFKEALDNPKLRPNPELPTTFLMTLLSFVLFFNVFIFNGQHFQQLIGTAMGTRVAPTFACIFMGWLETMILATWMGTQPHLWRRYMMIFSSSGMVQKKNSLDLLNTAIPHMKLLSSHSTTASRLDQLTSSIFISG